MNLIHIDVPFDMICRFALINVKMELFSFLISSFLQFFLCQMQLIDLIFINNIFNNIKQINVQNI